MKIRQASDRDLTLDLARGLAITMIVVGHVVRGLVTSGIVPEDATWQQVTDRLLYAVHLGVFGFSAGLFVARGVDRDGVVRYLRRRDVTLLWLYLVWSLLQGVVKLAAGSTVNSTTSVLDIVDLLHPEGQLWFIPWLVVVSTLAALTRIWRTRVRAFTGAGIALIVSLLAWGSFPEYAGTQGVGLWVFFAVGVACGDHAVRGLLQALTWRQATAIAVLALTACTSLVAPGIAATPTPSSGPPAGPISATAGLIATSLGIIGVLTLSRALAEFRLTWMAALGRRSLEVFLGSVIFGSGARIVLEGLGCTSPLVHISVGTVAGIGAPMMIAAMAHRLRLNWLYAAPRALREGR